MSGGVTKARPGAGRGLCVLTGGALLLWTALIPDRALHPPGPANAETPPVEGYHTRLQSTRRVQAALRGHTEATAPRKLNALVHRSMAHGPSPQLRASDNWLAWTIGLAWGDARMTQDPRRLASMGVGLCSDAAIVLGELAIQAGLEYEIFDLRGHVVGQVRVNGTAWILDPDYGIAFEGGLARMEEDARDGSLAARLRDLGHGETPVDAYVALALTATSANLVPGRRLSPRLAHLEHLLDIAAWTLPSCLILWALRPRRRRPAC